MDKKETASLYVKGIPEEVKREFKATCIRNGTTMKEVIQKLMREYISVKKTR